MPLGTEYGLHILRTYPIKSLGFGGLNRHEKGFCDELEAKAVCRVTLVITSG